jgi:hypothetical protein
MVTNGVITAGQGTSNVTVLWGEEGVGTLSVTETNSEGCSGNPSTIEVEVVCATTATVINGPLGPNALTETSYTCDGSASSTYVWTITNGVITSGQGTNSISVLWAGTGLATLTVQETTSASCEGDLISINVVVIPTSVDETIAKSFSLYPNPTEGRMVIDLGEGFSGVGYTLNLHNAKGQMVYTTELNTSQVMLDLRSLGGAGVYHASVLNARGVTIVSVPVLVE